MIATYVKPVNMIKYHLVAQILRTLNITLFW